MTGLLASALDYPLDPARIACSPATPRDAAKLMVVERATGNVVHAHVRDLPSWVREGDSLVVNRTRVIRARLRAFASPAGPGVEGLMVEPRGDGSWHALVKRSKKFRAGDEFILTASDGRTHGDVLKLQAREGDGWVASIRSADGSSTEAAMERSGWTPLPPYILKARVDRHSAHEDDEDRQWYQTVFAQSAAQDQGPNAHGSVAAPTAGLHFTPELMPTLRARGMQALEVELRVGAGTFKPVEAATLAEHVMHAEWCHVPRATLAQLARLAPERAAARARLVAVGTTTVRTLESLPDPLPTAEADWSTDTRLLIQPGHEFRFVDALLTNFHLPRSTLLALVGAFVGIERLKELYAIAQEREYRFFSYGDAMLIV
jgi:S-adenosylmethionine:tRNA ribosyltransferase-isomerase